MICNHYHYSSSLKASTKLFCRELRKICQFFARKQLASRLSCTHTQTHTLWNKQIFTDADVDIVSHLGPVVRSLVWLNLSFRWKKESGVSNTPLHNFTVRCITHTQFRCGLDQGCRLHTCSGEGSVFMMTLINPQSRIRWSWPQESICELRSQILGAPGDVEI